ncbi:MAG: cytochrome c biogenesis protein [Bdellovibrionota bacterium]
MTIERFISLDTLLGNRWFRAVLPLAAVLSVMTALAVVFLVVPDEQEMGAVQRIFYFHVGSAVTSYGMIALMLVGSAFYLVTRQDGWSVLAQSAASVAFLFCSIVLVTGMIWAHSAWNVWWRWEPRLASSLVLWLILGGYLLLGSFAAEHPGQRNFLAVLGIVSAVFVPVVIFSIRLLNEHEQAHPQVIARQGLADPSFKYALILSIVSLLLVALWLWAVNAVRLLLAAERNAVTREIRNLRWELNEHVRVGNQ